MVWKMEAEEIAYQDVKLDQGPQEKCVIKREGGERKWGVREDLRWYTESPHDFN